MNSHFKLLICMVFLVGSLKAQVRQEQDYQRTFSANGDTKVEIVNKYGEVIVRTWAHDSVKFEVVVKAEGRNGDVVKKAMSRVEVKFRKVGVVISGITEISSGKGLFSSMLSEVEGAVKSNKLQIDYEVWIPEGVLLSVENKFGDVYLADLTGAVELDVSHGDIKANNIGGDLDLKQHFGKSSFAHISTAEANLRAASVEIDQVEFLKCESASSDIQLGDVQRVQFNSRNDDISIGKVRHLAGDGSFTDIIVDDANSTVNLDFSYGEIYLRRVDKEFSSVEIRGKSSDVDLVLDQASFIKTFIKGPEDKMILPNSMLALQKEMLDGGHISLSGDVGNTNTQHSKLLIELQEGKLIIAIQDTLMFSEK